MPFNRMTASSDLLEIYKKGLRGLPKPEGMNAKQREAFLAGADKRAKLGRRPVVPPRPK